MKRTLIAAAAVALVAGSGIASAASWTDVVAPGNYGRVLVGGYAQAPSVYNNDPAVLGQDPVWSPLGWFLQGLLQPQEPVYMWVPGYQRSNWSQYCYQYNACNVPVYFVQDGWYQQNVMTPTYWSPQMYGWNQAQWIEQDRLARQRWEAIRWEQNQAARERWQAQQWRYRNWVDQARERQTMIDQHRFDVEQQQLARQRQLDQQRWQQQHVNDQRLLTEQNEIRMRAQTQQAQLRVAQDHNPPLRTDPQIAVRAEQQQNQARLQQEQAQRVQQEQGMRQQQQQAEMRQQQQERAQQEQQQQQQRQQQQRAEQAQQAQAQRAQQAQQQRAEQAQQQHAQQQQRAEQAQEQRAAQQQRAEQQQRAQETRGDAGRPAAHPMPVNPSAHAQSEAGRGRPEANRPAQEEQRNER